ncbi:MAG: VWA domain-containing protein [Holophagales bacterium]|nr:VWA domain-containing protein [Holophagales bacterium]MYF95624.1 VWA domain-containing protein [Holophagales bacterium]
MSTRASSSLPTRSRRSSRSRGSARPKQLVPRCGRVGAAAPALFIAAAVLAAAATPAAAQGSRRPQARLTDFYEQWLAEVEPLLAEAERRALERLEGPGARERFLRAFWAARPERLLERWQENREARDQLRERSPAMDRAVLLAGKPAYRQTVEPCESELRRIEIWTYDGWRLEHQLGRPPLPDEDEIVLVFVQQVNFDPRSLRLWSPSSGVDLTFEPVRPDGNGRAAEAPPTGASRVLDQAERRRCLTPTERRRLERRLGRAVGWRDFIERLGWVSATSDTSWVERFLRVEAVLDVDAMALPGVALDFEAVGTENRRTAMRGRLRLPPEHLAAIGAGQILDRVTITGDVFLRDRLADAFVVTHHVSGGNANIALDFYRRLPAGAYRIEIRAEDHLGRGLLRLSSTLEVPALDVQPDVPGLGLLSRRETIALNQSPSVELLAPEGRVLGSTFTARVVASPAVSRLVLLRDGETVATVDAPPFVQDIHLPDRRHQIEVRGHDAAGALLARHALEVEREEHPFSIALERPDPAFIEEALDLSVRVDVPSGRELDRVDCHLDAELLESMTAPPFRCRVPAGLRLPLSFVRAAATLRTGETVEDLVFLGPGAPDEIEVRLVDLLVSVGGRQAGPATGLDAADFRVLHRGVEARIRDFRNLADRPLTVALLMDISSSMGRGVRVAATSAQRFFEGILTDRDTASLIVFNHDLDRLAPFSGDTRLLRYAAEGLRAWGATRLYDGIAYAVSSFAGRPDRRALVVLSDGADTDSNLDFEPVLAQVELAGVVVYPIALRVSDPATTEALRRLAERTGGRYHTADSVEDLDRVYREIERALRSQYLIAFEPPPGIEAGGDGLRDIQVAVSRAGLTVTGVRSRGR